ncbi:MAG: hypothetical protein ACFB0C_09335 [Leptolyngbyaceae cyanobacterium]
MSSAVECFPIDSHLNLWPPGFKPRTPLALSLIPPALTTSSMPKTICLKTQETATIYRRNFSSVPIDIQFDAIALDGGQPIGEVEVQGSNWVFPKPPSTQPLQAQNTVHAGFWDTFFSIRVTAHTPIEITFPQKGIDLSRGLIFVIAAVILIAASAVVIFAIAQ